MSREIAIAGRPIGPDHRPYIVAELSANHLGGIERAFAIMAAAKRAGADAVKLQTYTADTITIDHDGPGFVIEGGLWDGRRLYELARQGLTVEREPRQITVHAITLEALALPELTIRIRCGKGTYVRTLAADVGAALGCGGTLASLIRTRVGPYMLASAVSWAELREARAGAPLWARLLPCDSALVAWPAVKLDAAEAVKFVHGRTVPAPGSSEGRVRVYSTDGACLGVGLGRGGAVKPERLLHVDPARPSVLPA